MNHRHDPIEIKLPIGVGWNSGEKCRTCELRRAVYPAMGRRRTDRFSKWVAKDEAEGQNLIWLWRDEISVPAKQSEEK